MAVKDGSGSREELVQRVTRLIEKYPNWGDVFCLGEQMAATGLPPFSGDQMLKMLGCESITQGIILAETYGELDAIRDFNAMLDDYLAHPDELERIEKEHPAYKSLPNWHRFVEGRGRTKGLMAAAEVAEINGPLGAAELRRLAGKEA